MRRNAIPLLMITVVVVAALSCGSSDKIDGLDAGDSGSSIDSGAGGDGDTDGDADMDSAVDANDLDASEDGGDKCQERLDEQDACVLPFECYCPSRVSECDTFGTFDRARAWAETNAGSADICLYRCIDGRARLDRNYPPEGPYNSYIYAATGELIGLVKGVDYNQFCDGRAFDVHIGEAQDCEASCIEAPLDDAGAPLCGPGKPACG